MSKVIKPMKNTTGTNLTLVTANAKLSYGNWLLIQSLCVVLKISNATLACITFSSIKLYATWLLIRLKLLQIVGSWNSPE